MDLSRAFNPNHDGDVDRLQDLMDFDHVIRVTDGRAYDDVPNDVRELWAPEVRWEDDGHVLETYSDLAGWTLLEGFSGQYRYSGPIMHESECIGGRLARHILEHDGYYVALVCDEYGEEESTPVGWAIAYRGL